jgi:hypothetical protein
LQKRTTLSPPRRAPSRQTAAQTSGVITGSTGNVGNVNIGNVGASVGTPGDQSSRRSAPLPFAPVRAGAAYVL